MRDLFWLALAVVIFIAAYQVRAVVLPVLIALALAYIVNPLVAQLKRQSKVPRSGGTAIVMGAIIIAMLVIALLVVPTVVTQAGNLIGNMKQYGQYISKETSPVLDHWRERLDILPTLGGDENGESKTGDDDRAEGDAGEGEPGGSDKADDGAGDDAVDNNSNAADDNGPPPDQPPVAGADHAKDAESAQADTPTIDDLTTLPPDDTGSNEYIAYALDELSRVELSKLGQFLLQSLNVGVGVVGSAINFTAYLVLAGVIISFCFFFFSWKFDKIINWFDQFIPTANRAQTLRMIKRMDQSVSAFIRGRLIQSLVMMTILTVGWRICDVPYFLLLGIACGVLNLVPYAAVIGWVAAIAFALLEQVTGGSGEGFSIWILVWPTVVYAIAQLLDGWVIEPLVQGQATGLDPVSVMLAVLIGGALFGLLGLILAIPATACLKILGEEFVIPRLRADTRSAED